MTLKQNFFRRRPVARPATALRGGRPSLLLLGCALLAFAGCGRLIKTGVLPVQPNQEDRTPNNSPYTPGTVSFLRYHHWLEEVRGVELRIGRDLTGCMIIDDADPEHGVELCNIPFSELVPRLHYQPADPPDDFDALNLLLAEYSRNSISVPRGLPGDKMAYFKSDFTEMNPWTLGGDYEFIPNRLLTPNRMSIINNCLRPGLWELSANDRSGEIYHGWFDFPPDDYYRLTAAVNNLPVEFVKNALEWNTREVPLRLERLRDNVRPLGEFAARLAADSASGYSSQDSRRKLSKGYVKVEDENGALKTPQRLYELTASPVYLAEFVDPGKYSITNRREFKLQFLCNVQSARVFRTNSRTCFNWRACPVEQERRRGKIRECIELWIDLGEYQVIIGNLDLSLLVPQEDYEINGYGVGVLHSADFAERRKILIEDGPSPPFAYLCRKTDNGLVAVNSHEFGLEQIYIRTLLRSGEKFWSITLTSYERIVDIVKYDVPIPAELHAELNDIRLTYITPLYRTYRDDNIN